MAKLKISLYWFTRMEDILCALYIYHFFNSHKSDVTTVRRFQQIVATYFFLKDLTHKLFLGDWSSRNPIKAIAHPIKIYMRTSHQDSIFYASGFTTSMSNFFTTP